MLVLAHCCCAFQDVAHLLCVGVDQEDVGLIVKSTNRVAIGYAFSNLSNRRMADLDNSFSVVRLAVKYDQVPIRSNHQLLIIVNHRALHAIAKPIQQINAVQQSTFLGVVADFACFADD